MDYFYSKVFIINSKFVVAPTINEAIELYQEVFPDTELMSVTMQAADTIWKDCDALILKKE